MKFDLINTYKDEYNYKLRICEKRYISFKILERLEIHKKKYSKYTRSRSICFKKKKQKLHYLYIKYKTMRFNLN